MGASRQITTGVRVQQDAHTPFGMERILRRGRGVKDGGKERRRDRPKQGKKGGK